MRTIWKFPVKVDDLFELVMPKGARVLSVQNQGINGPQMWAIVDSKAPTERRRFRIFGTGHPMGGDEALDYVGTFQASGGALVWHLFEVTP